MFAKVSELSINLNQINYIISLGFAHEDGIDIDKLTPEEAQKAIQFSYVIHKITEIDGKKDAELVQPDDSDEFKHVDMVAKIFAEGFSKGGQYAGLMMKQQMEEAAKGIHVADTDKKIVL